MKNETDNSASSTLMQYRKITLKDGRYMIFYTFDESLSIRAAETEQKPETIPDLEATEEKNV